MQKIENIISELDQFILQKQDYDTKNVGLLGGISGIIYYCFNSKNSELLDRGYELLNTLIDEISAEPIHHYPYANGVCGVLYLLNSLKENGHIDDDIESFIKPIEDFIVQNIIPKDNLNDNKDFLYGLFGYLHYFVSKPSSIRNHSIINHLLAKIFDSRIETENGIYFSNNFYNNGKVPNHFKEIIEPSSVINFGLAHGNLAIGLILLNILDKYPSDVQFVDDLVKIADLYLSHFIEKNFENGKSMFPTLSIHHTDYTIFNKLPLSWCYGDLSIAIFLYRVFLLTNESKYSKQAILIINKYLDSNVLEQNQDIDPYYCHGYTGIIAQFDSLNSLIKDVQLSERIQLLNSSFKLKLYSAIPKEINQRNNIQEFYATSLDLLNGMLAIGMLYNGISNDWKKIFLN